MSTYCGNLKKIRVASSILSRKLTGLKNVTKWRQWGLVSYPRTLSLVQYRAKSLVEKELRKSLQFYIILKKWKWVTELFLSLAFFFFFSFCIQLLWITKQMMCRIYNPILAGKITRKGMKYKWYNISGRTSKEKENQMLMSTNKSGSRIMHC